LRTSGVTNSIGLIQHLKKIFYSGGAKATAMFSIVSKTLKKQCFKVNEISETNNPIYLIK
jgi:arsenate reductase